MTSQLSLQHVGVARAHALLAGSMSALAPLRAAPGWPHADSMDGIRVSIGDAKNDEDTPLLAVLDGEVIGEGGWKGGLSPDGVAEITAWVLDQPGANRVVAEVLADNLPSRRALERNGYVLTHTDDPYVWYAFPP